MARGQHRRTDKDGHPRSWQLVPSHSDRYPRHAWTRHDLYVTQYRDCEGFASDNAAQHPGAPCKDDVAKFVSGETLKRPVLWGNVGFHHIARDEDQTPMPVHLAGLPDRPARRDGHEPADSGPPVPP